MVMLSMVVILVSTLWTGLVGGWHGTLALALVKEVVAEGKGFQYLLAEVGYHKQRHQANIGLNYVSDILVRLR